MNSLFTFRVEIARKSSTYDALLVFIATRQLDSEVLATVVETELESNLVPDELLIVVRDTAFKGTLSDLNDNSQNIATLARLGRRASVTLIGYNVHGYEAQRSSVTEIKPGFVIKLEEFKRRAITHIFNTRHGFVESTSTYHFENPSGRHTERFIRLSNLLVRGAEIAFIGFCTLPYIAEETEIAYLDTPSLYAVVSAINEQRASFQKAAILADNFSSYAGVDSYQFNQIDRSVVLISASSSGSLASGLINDHSFVRSQIIHMLLLGSDKSGSNIVCNLRQDKLNPEGIATAPAVEEANECRMCASGSHAIKLQGDQFEFAGPQQDSLLIGKADAPLKLSEVMERLVGGNILGVIAGPSSGGRTRLFNVHAPSLLAHGPFHARLDYVLRRSLPVSVGGPRADGTAQAEKRRGITRPAGTKGGDTVFILAG